MKIDVLEMDFDPNVALFDPGGILIGHDNDGGDDGLDARLVETAADTGSYKVEVGYPTATASGEFAISVSVGGTNGGSNVDTDGDGRTDAEETAAHFTDPNQSDTDGDGLSDYDEVFTSHTDPKHPDTDRDGLDDNTEYRHLGTDPSNPDTDGDGLTDGHEVSSNSDPFNP